MKRIYLALLASFSLFAADEAIDLPEPDPGAPAIGGGAAIASDYAKQNSIVIGVAVTTAVAITGILVSVLSSHGTTQHNTTRP
ncbi:MAG: hypothetical protein KBC64_03355 [Simkaniaceae bacterium]|nr:hypothetical protein [Simkaniaceae bacterium]